MVEKTVRLLLTAGYIAYDSRLYIWFYRAMDLRCFSMGRCFWVLHCSFKL